MRSRLTVLVVSAALCLAIAAPAWGTHDDSVKSKIDIASAFCDQDANGPFCFFKGAVLSREKRCSDERVVTLSTEGEKVDRTKARKPGVFSFRVDGTDREQTYELFAKRASEGDLTCLPAKEEVTLEPPNF
jgi:hypothetical protein